MPARLAFGSYSICILLSSTIYKASCWSTFRFVYRLAADVLFEWGFILFRSTENPFRDFNVATPQYTVTWTLPPSPYGLYHPLMLSDVFVETRSWSRDFSRTNFESLALGLATKVLVLISRLRSWSWGKYLGLVLGLRNSWKFPRLFRDVEIHFPTMSAIHLCRIHRVIATVFIFNHNVSVSESGYNILM